nr:Chain B, 4E-BINDING PROTEIN THOR [Drosophila melanogaster]
GPHMTKLIYERAFMKNLRGSPLSQTPPSNVPSCLLRGT